MNLLVRPGVLFHGFPVNSSRVLIDFRSNYGRFCPQNSGGRTPDLQERDAPRRLILHHPALNIARKISANIRQVFWLPDDADSKGNPAAGLLIFQKRIPCKLDRLLFRRILRSLP